MLSFTRGLFANHLRGVCCSAGLILLCQVTACSPPESEPESHASLSRVRLMSGEQYHNAIANVFGSQVSGSVIAPLPPFQRTDGLLASGASSVGLTSDQVSQIQLAATQVAASVVAEDYRDYLLSCSPRDTSAADDACAAEILRESGRLLFRRPLSEARTEALVALARDASETTEDFYGGLALALEALLISPEFLFIIEVSEPNPDLPGSQRLDAYSLASRLSFFLWNGPPDAVLLDAAAKGELFQADLLAAQVDRMLASERLVTGMRTFFDDMLAFDDFDSLSKDPIVYPTVTGATLADAREQTLRTITHHLLDEEADYRDLFTTRDIYMSASLAAVYGAPAEDGWALTQFPEESPRAGLLTHVSFLAANAHTVRSSPTLRGKAMRERFLCQHVPDPPPNVDFSSIEDAGEVATARERLNVHNTNPSCAGCHLITDPMGLSLEVFDGAGLYRETENGAEIDIAGELDGVFYDDVAGLTQAMRNHPKLAYCLVNRLYAYGTGGAVELRYDRAILKWFEAQFESEGYRLPELLRTMTTSRAFSAVRPDGDAEGMSISQGSAISGLAPSEITPSEPTARSR